MRRLIVAVVAVAALALPLASQASATRSANFTVTSSADRVFLEARYYRPGPLSPLLAPAITALFRAIFGQIVSFSAFPDAGPSAFEWGTPGAEEHPINDMDYDFDVPLPRPPDGATAAVLEVTTQPQHTTGVAEVVTYTNSVNGLPTIAG